MCPAIRCKFNQAEFILLSLLVILVSCQAESAEEGPFVIHPLDENIPHFERDHNKIDTTRAELPADLPTKLFTLHDYLSHPEKYEESSLEIFVSGMNTDIAALSDGQIVIVDKNSDKFILHDISVDSTISLADQGRGPGDIAYVQEMVVSDSLVYVAMEDMRISEFICSYGSCEYNQTISLDYSAVSVAESSDRFAVLGQSVLGENSGGEVDTQAVRVVDRQGNQINSFGSFYSTDHWIVLFSIRGGFVRYSEELNKYLLAFKSLPLIYSYDEEFELVGTYKFEEYLQGEIAYNTVLNAASPPVNNMTVINRFDIVDERFLFIHNRTVYEDDSAGNENVRKHRHDYYAIDLSTDKSYFLGSSRNGESSAIYPLQDDLILNQGGELFLVERQKL